MGCGVWGGRGNLRENREDPAPTVGIAVALRAKYRPFLPHRHAHTVHHACLPPMGGPYNLYHDAACRVATFFENLNCLIEISLPVRRENPPPIEPLPGLSPRSLLEYGGLNPILPFLGGRSDAARRVVIWTSSLPSMGILRFLQRRIVILPFAIPVDPPMGANDGRCGIPRNDLPANADCRGAVHLRNAKIPPPAASPCAYRAPRKMETPQSLL